MPQPRRRDALRSVVAVLTLGLAGCGSSPPTGGNENTETTASTTETPTPTPTPEPTPVPEDVHLEALGHSLLHHPEKAFGGLDVTDDGRYAVIGSLGQVSAGSVLVDLSRLELPRMVHHLPSPPKTADGDVKFGTREGLYYRSLGSSSEEGEDGFEVVDYGYGTGTPTDPVALGQAPAGATHNLFPHPERPLVYTVNIHDPASPGLDVWDVSDPTTPNKVIEAGPGGRLHDLSVDAERGLAHLAYIGGEFEGYAALDVSDPRSPTELGRLDYAELPPYPDEGMARGYERAHFVTFDPRRDIVIVGDEKGVETPGGKQVIDVGWADGSPEDPRPLGFVRSPTAQYQDRLEKERLDWTGHNFDIFHRDGLSLLVSGDYHDGVVVYDLSDPRSPAALDQHLPVEGVGRARGPFEKYGSAPMTFGAYYNRARDAVVAVDMLTGIHTLEIQT